MDGKDLVRLYPLKGLSDSGNICFSILPAHHGCRTQSGEMRGVVLPSPHSSPNKGMAMGMMSQRVKPQISYACPDICYVTT